MKLIKVGNGTPIYPGNFTKKEKNIIIYNIKYPVLHLFSGSSLIGSVRVDYRYGNIKKDVFEYLNDYEEVKNSCFNTIIIDAPYNQRFADKYQKLGDTPEQFVIFANAKKTTELFNHVKRLQPEIIILKSWNYYCLEGYKVNDCYVCYPGGYRKSTFLIIMKKKQNVFYEDEEE